MTVFKRQAVFEGIKHLYFKCPEGNRWVEHQRDALKSHHNLVILIGFCNNQIISPHNDSFKKIVAQLEGIKMTHFIKPYPKQLTLDLTNTSKSKIFLVMLQLLSVIFLQCSIIIILIAAKLKMSLK